MVWTAEAVEDLKRLALEGWSASGIAAALGVALPQRGHRQGEPDRDQTRRRRARLCARRGAARRASGAMGGCSPRCPARQPELRRRQCCRTEAAGAMGLCRSRGWRDAAGEVRGNSRIRLPVAARRSEKRGVRLLRACAGQGPAPIAPAIAGWPIGRQTRGRARVTGKGSARSRIRGGRSDGGVGCLRASLPRGPLEYADEAWRIRARFAPVDAAWMRSGRKLSPRAIVST